MSRGKVVALALAGLLVLGLIAVALSGTRAGSRIALGKSGQASRGAAHGPRGPSDDPRESQPGPAGPDFQRAFPPGKMRIPRNDDSSLQQMTGAVALTPTQVRRVKPLLTTLLHAQELVERYPEPKRQEKQALLDRQAYIALLTAVSHDQWPLLDQYLATL